MHALHHTLSCLRAQVVKDLPAQPKAPKDAGVLPPSGRTCKPVPAGAPQQRAEHAAGRAAEAPAQQLADGQPAPKKRTTLVLPCFVVPAAAARRIAKDGQQEPATPGAGAGAAASRAASAAPAELHAVAAAASVEGRKPRADNVGAAIPPDQQTVMRGKRKLAVTAAARFASSGAATPAEPQVATAAAAAAAAAPPGPQQPQNAARAPSPPALPARAAAVPNAITTAVPSPARSVPAAIPAAGAPSKPATTSRGRPIQLPQRASAGQKEAPAESGGPHAALKQQPAVVSKPAGKLPQAKQIAAQEQSAAAEQPEKPKPPARKRLQRLPAVLLSTLPVLRESASAASTLDAATVIGGPLRMSISRALCLKSSSLAHERHVLLGPGMPYCHLLSIPS